MATSAIPCHAESRFPLTRRADGRWCRKFNGRMHYFRGTAEEALAQWNDLQTSLTTAGTETCSNVSVVRRPIDSIRPSPESESVYGRVDRNDDEDFASLIDDIRINDILEPIVVSDDGFIISGHRRYAAAKRAHLDSVPCRTHHIRREDDIDAFVRCLVSFNKQRVKTVTHKLHESFIKESDDDAYEELLAERARRVAVDTEPLELGQRRNRSEITDAKHPMLDAVLGILTGYTRAQIEKRREPLPLLATIFRDAHEIIGARNDSAQGDADDVD